MYYICVNSAVRKRIVVTASTRSCGLTEPEQKHATCTALGYNLVLHGKRRKKNMFTHSQNHWPECACVVRPAAAHMPRTESCRLERWRSVFVHRHRCRRYAIRDMLYVCCMLYMRILRACAVLCGVNRCATQICHTHTCRLPQRSCPQARMRLRFVYKGKRWL